MSDESKERIIEKLKLEGFWDNMSLNQRRGAAVVGGISVLFLGMALLTAGDDTSSSKARETVKRSVLTEINTRSIGIDALNAKVKRVESENDGLSKNLKRIQTELTDLKRRRGNDPDMTRQMAVLQNQVKSLTDKAKTIGWEVADIKEGYYVVPEKTTDQKSNSKPGDLESSGNALQTRSALKPVDFKKKLNDIEKGLNKDPNSYFQTNPVRNVSPTPTVGAPNIKTGARSASELTIFTTESESQENEDEGTNAGEELYIPAGSILSGVMLNGLDAPTGRSARNDPYPVLVRIQKDAILPNQFSADVKECFATLSGYGELSSERAYLRGEMFSCITVNGDVIEVSFPSYAVGEDGKAGIRGRLISKAGSLIAKTTLAGFAAGIAEAFDTSPVPVIQTGGLTGNKVYQDNFSSGAAKHGVSSGASAALTRLADYYMDMADQIFPVIEVDAGRRIDMILTNGFKLKIKKNKSIKLAKKG